MSWFVTLLLLIRLALLGCDGPDEFELVVVISSVIVAAVIGATVVVVTMLVVEVGSGNETCLCCLKQPRQKCNLHWLILQYSTAWTLQHDGWLLVLVLYLLQNFLYMMSSFILNIMTK